MPQYDEAFFATKLKTALEERHPKLVFEEVSGISVGGGALKAIHVKLAGGGFEVLPLPRPGLPDDDVELAIYRSTCRRLGLTPVEIAHVH